MGAASVETTGALTREAMGIREGLPLSVSPGGLDELRRDIQRLMDIEAIKQQSFTTGSALYWDRYRKVAGRWKIRETRYRRIYEITRPIEEMPAFSVRYLEHHGS